MEARLQRRVQRYGWDRAAEAYDLLWSAQLAPAQAEVMACAGLKPGERVLDVACGTGATALEAARRVAPGGEVTGVDLSQRMVDTAAARAAALHCDNACFMRMDAEELALAEGSFDAVLCVLGLMYVPRPEDALRQMRRALRPGGRIVLAVWAERSRCGWAEVFPIVDAEVRSEVCPLFFRLGQGTTLPGLCASAGFSVTRSSRVTTTLSYASPEEACDAALVGGPVALAWSRLDSPARARVRRRYLDSLEPWRDGDSFRIPGEFVVVSAISG